MTTVINYLSLVLIRLLAQREKNKKKHKKYDMQKKRVRLMAKAHIALQFNKSEQKNHFFPPTFDRRKKLTSSSWTQNEKKKQTKTQFKLGEKYEFSSNKTLIRFCDSFTDKMMPANVILITEQATVAMKNYKFFFIFFFVLRALSRSNG